ncbi:MAG: sialate O-acetylesterase [Bacteroidota bacterium]
MRTTILLLFTIAISLSSLEAQLRMPQIFSDHMVLRREKPIELWGWAKGRDKITIQIGEMTYKTKAEKDGTWSIALDEMQAGGPYTLRVSTKRERLEFTDVLLGDVWICSGQSNMEWSLTNTNDAQAEIANANHPQIRLFDVKHNIQFSPVEDLEQDQFWQTCSPMSIPSFSSVAYFFGRKLQQELDVPIGLISTNWGGTEVETWMRKEAIEAVPSFEGIASQLSGEARARFEATQKEQYDKLMASFGDSKGGLIEGNPIWAANDLDESEWEDMMLPNLWESAGLPNLDGIVWFRFSFEIPNDQALSDAQILLGPIDDNDITYLNGQEIGRYNGYNTPRVYEVSKGALRKGKNVIAVRVEDTGGGGGLWGKAGLYQFKMGGMSVPLSGKWKYRVSPQGVALNLALGPNDQPTLLYNGMIAPLLPYGIKGAIWYQGESNAGRAEAYQKLFPAMIENWREDWGYEFPFFWVQLANFKAAKEQAEDSDWAELREAQSMTLSLPKTGEAVIIDIGEADDIHPRNKQDVGLRLALAALHVAYEQEIVYSGPRFKKASFRSGKATLEFEHIGSGLVANDRYGYLKGFAIAGEDRQWHWAQAYIEGDKVVVSSSNVANPVAVRYAWADNPDDANLYNAEGLPASPFRTDDWPMITAGVRKTYQKF